MDLVTSIGLFLSLAIFLVILFCLITKYFQYRMNNKIEQQGQTYSQVDQMTQPSDEELQNQYQQFLEKRKLVNDKKKSKRTKQCDQLLQNTRIQQPMRNSTDQIYGVSMLRRRLDGQVLPMREQTSRSLHSSKSFRPQRLHTGRQNLNSKRGLLNKPEQKLIVHEFVSKIIAYNQQGIQIMDVIVNNLSKQKGNFRQKKTIKTTKFGTLDQGFEDYLQVLGFQLNQYSCCQFKTKVQIPFMIQNQQYPLSSLKTSESKEQIDFSQYYMLKDKIESQKQ